MKYKESYHQSKFFEWLALTFPKLAPICFAIPNEGKRNIGYAMALKARGMKSGIPDVFCAIPNRSHHGLFFEFKSQEAKLTKNQISKIDLLKTQGYECVVCRSFGEAIEFFISYLTN